MHQNSSYQVAGNKYLGVFFMLLHAFAIACVYVIKKDLVQILDPEYVAFLYRFMVLLLILPYCLAKGFRDSMSTAKIHLYIPKALLATIATICFTKSLQTLNVADASAVTYIEGAVVSVIGILCFHEKNSLGKIIMISTSFIGALLIMKPWNDGFNVGYLYAIGAVLCWTLNNVIIKILGRTEKNRTQVFYNAVLTSIIAFAVCLLRDINFRSIVDILNPKCIAVIFGLGIFHLTHMAAFFASLRISEISFVMPFDYTRLLFTTFLAYIVLGEIPSYDSLYSYMVIALSAVGVLYFNKSKC